MTKYHITRAGLERFQQELDELKRRRPKVIAAITAAREQGDLSENSEYQTAREEQVLLDNRVDTLEDILKNHILISEQTQALRVVGLGSKVHLEAISCPNKTQQIFEVVGTVEADPFNGRISDDSLIGRNLLGKNIGEEIMLPTPDGQKAYKITAIKWKASSQSERLLKIQTQCWQFGLEMTADG